MKNLRKKFNLFCYRHHNVGIPNLMLYVALGNALVYIVTVFFQNTAIYDLLCFDRELILQGQIWRLFSYAITYLGTNPVLTFLFLYCYFSLGRAIEHTWGTLRFNIFYFSGIILMDVYCLIFPCYPNVSYLNMSLFVAYATLYPDAHFLLFMIIPVKARILALIDLLITIISVISLSFPIFAFPYNLFPLVALGNYFLFFGKDVLNILPVSWRLNTRRLFRKKPPKAKVIPFPKAGSYEAETTTPKANYLHRCTVCGRTDASHPDLEFRYCSRCNGYYCYCEEHISNHSHIQ